MIEGKTVIITGASRGIGAEAARQFAAAGAGGIVLCARGADGIEALAAEIGPRALAVRADVSRHADMEALVRRACATFGRVDVLINNAAVIQPIARLADADAEQWRRAVEINLVGVFNATRAVLPQMLRQGGGTVLTVSSGAAHRPLEAWSHYCASKAGAAMLTRCLDLEERASGIRAIGLSPGTVATRMQREIRESGINPVARLDWSEHIPPQWVARALLWMCGPEADPFLGDEISLRNEEIRRRIGLVP